MGRSVLQVQLDRQLRLARYRSSVRRTAVEARPGLHGKLAAGSKPRDNIGVSWLSELSGRPTHDVGMGRARQFAAALERDFLGKKKPKDIVRENRCSLSLCDRSLLVRRR